LALGEDDAGEAAVFVFVVVAVVVGVVCWAHLLLGWEMSGNAREVVRIRD
jgi:hypothetical protein